MIKSHFGNGKLSIAMISVPSLSVREKLKPNLDIVTKDHCTVIFIWEIFWLVM